jgi:hypothetical protein
MNIEFDLSKLPHLERVEFNDDVISQWEPGDRHPHSTYVSTIEWATEVIRYRKETIQKNIPIVEAGGWPSSSQAKYTIESAEKDLLYWEHIALPCAIAFVERLKNDHEIEPLSADERKLLKGRESGILIKGPNLSLGALSLKPGDRVIDNYHAIKYVYQEFLWRRTPYGFPKDTHALVHEGTGKLKHITDHEAFQKLPGKGKVIPTKEVISAIAEDAGLDMYEYYDYLRNTVDRYMRRNKVLEMTEEHINAVVDLIKTVS